MRSPRAQRILELGIRKQAEAQAGGMREMMSFSASRTGSILVDLPERLPALYNDDPTDTLQDANGNFYFLNNYSAAGGPDILR